eukprot:CAMPEP_0113669616 /NCGR_PEP_ID=MMETSP0038_2-20120614/4673_1 /TAXON_ID=2898 /ORGANISM="Cryptomonas paramecium" /LENGTH=218 /DNA_ID=CAMNT_0000585527 /DNA_START=80 /DNA_END=732 /DNA_ORIENTATION=+ /assembly_acc=CAM_ASM_000170
MSRIDDSRDTATHRQSARDFTEGSRAKTTGKSIFVETKRKIFKCYVGGHGNDFSNERQAIRDIVPELFRLCAERDISFDCVDLQHSYPNLPSLTYPTIVLLEMKSCFEETTVGFRHIALIGNSVGARPLPLYLSRTDYASAIEKIESDEDKALFNFWYQKEEGCLPIRYRLANIFNASPIIQGGADMDDLSMEERFAAVDEFRKVEDKLKQLVGLGVG